MRFRLRFARLAELIAESPLSQNHWALKVGVSRGHWSELVHGKHVYPSPRTRMRMLEAFRVAEGELFEREPGPAPWEDVDFRRAVSDRYIIDSEIGQGGMGAVYHARDVKHGRSVAVKVIAAEIVSGIGLKQFQREISTVAKLMHPNILPLFDSGVAAGQPFFVMPLVRAGSLRDLLRTRIRLGISATVTLADGIARALHHAHREQVLHCDVKPENVVLFDGYHPFVTDFGIARILRTDVGAWSLRHELDFSAGTPAYVSPEQASGERDLDARSDVYSTACLVFEMLAGRTPFEGATTQAVVARRFIVPPPPLRDFAPEVPPAMVAVIERAMSLPREHRQPTAAAFADELRHASRHASRLFAGASLTASRAVGAVRRAAHLRPQRGFGRHMTDIIRDTRYALRGLMREPAITAFILCTLALGIGINVAAFSVVDRVLLSGPQHVHEPDRLVRLYSRNGTPPLGVQTSPWLPHSAFVTMRDGMRSVAAVGAYRPGEAMVGSGASSDTRSVMLMSSEMFSLLGVQPVKGRFFGASEDAANVAVIGERYWRTTHGSDPDILGRSIAVDDVPHTIVGIAPAGFTGPELGRVDVWTPITVASRNSMNTVIVARLRPGVSVATAAREVALLRPQIEAGLPSFAGWLRGAEYLAAPIGYDANARESLESVMARWLAALSAIILFISCANVANLLLARLARRRREVAVRIALGAGRMRVVRLFALEGILLAIGSATLALAVIVLVEPLVQGALFPNGAWTFTLIDVRIIGAVAAFALLTGALVSAVPAIQAGRRDVNDALRGGNRGGDSRSRLRAGLTVVQAMLSVVLLVGAGLFLRSLQRVNAVDLGMDADKVLTVEVRYPRTARNAGESFSDWIARTSVLERERHRSLVDVARRVPGVAGAAVSVGVPFSGSVAVGLWVPGHDSIPQLPGGGPYVTAVGPDYFATMGTAIREGRPFTASDREGSEAVVVVSATMARAVWPEDRALGKCVIIASRDAPCARVVGIAADVHRSGLSEEPSLQYYVPIGQERGFSGSWLLVRPAGKRSTAWPALRDALQRADADIRSIDVRLLSHGLAREMRPFQLGMMAFGLSAALALIVAGLGLYSVMAHAVAWRRHEIGVRLALGARPGSIAASVVGRGAVLAAIGIGLGLIVAVGARRWLEPLLFNTSATDPVVIIGVVVVIQMLALVAGWVPARRVVGVNPTEALRSE